MKYSRFSVGLLLTIAAACTVEEVDIKTPDGLDPSVGKGAVYHAVIEDEASTKTYLDAGLNVLWNKGDHLTIFPNSTLGAEYEFKGEDGDPSGDLKPVEVESDGNYHVGIALDNHDYAIYPHSKDTKILSNGSITYTFPDVQTYQEKSFGRGANVMVAKTPHGIFNLNFKNVLGYLSFKFYGDNVHVSSIILEANGEEPELLSGKGTIVIGNDGPVVTMDESASNKIRLYCEDVLLGGESNPTEFWFALPPVAFTKAQGGFKITVTTTDGGVFTRNAAINLTIKRKTVERMDPLLVVPNYDETANNMAIESISSPRNDVTSNKTYDASESNGKFSLTIPTKTDFSQLQINFTLKTSSDILMVGGKEVKSGDFIDASQEETSLVVCRGYIEKTFKLITQNTGLPVVRITTGDSFTLGDLENQENALQSSDGEDHRKWLPKGSQNFVTIRIEMPDGSPGLKGFKEYETTTKIKGRGNYTWKWPKKPYALKFQNETQVLDMPAHNRWILLANWRDRTLLRNDAAFWLSRAAGMPYTVRGQFVELEINGQHRGNYYLCEQIKIAQGRVDITQIQYDETLGLEDPTEHTGGYLMEIDSYFDEVNKFHSSEFGLNYMFKEPDEDALTKTDSLYMQKYINDLEKIIYTKSKVLNHEYEDYFDVSSAIKFLLLNELTGNRDFFQGKPHYGPHSTYLYKDAGDKLFMGPVWDFDYETFIPEEYYPQPSSSLPWAPKTYTWRGFDNPGYYFYWLCADSQFVGNVQSIWSNLMTNTSNGQGFLDYIDDMVELIGPSQKFDEIMWPHKSSQENWNDNHDYGSSVPTYLDAIDLMQDSFSSKVNWMNTQIGGLTTETFASKRDWKY